MSLHHIASQLATAGRGEDSVLVHMTPKEVQGLQSLAQQHGGSLTTNPHTGLPEAGFLSAILPTIAGIGLSIVSGGALTPLMTAGIVGGLGALATGDIGKGLMAGIGAYGGAGLGTAMAAPAAASEAANPALFDNIAQNAANAGQSFAPNASQFGASDAMPGFQPSGEVGMANSFMPNAAPVMNPAVADTAIGTAEPQSLMGQMNPMQTATQGSPDYWNNAKNWAMNNKMQAGMMAAGPLMALSHQPVTQDTAQHGDRYSYDKANQNHNPNGPQYFNFQYGTPTVTHYAQGGDVRYPQSQIPNSSYAPSTQAPVPDEVIGAQDTAVDPYTGQQKFSNGGGISTLQPRMLSGEGTGLSDSIPAKINNKHPAQLADGEFVVSADVVSNLGGGSSKSGAKKLYDMMDRVRKGAHGTTKQIKPLNDKKVMPA